MKKVLLFILVSILMISNVDALKIVSLGDSIPDGYLLDDPDDSFDNRLANTLNADFYEFSYIGMRSDDLLEELEREEIKTNIEDADIVIINIGANDLLDLMDYIDLTIFDIDLENMQNPEIYLDSNYLNKIYNYLKNFFEKELKPMAVDAANDFKDIFPKIISKVKEYNPKVKIYVNNLYNPFFSLNIPLIGYNLDFISDTCEDAIVSFNDIINSNEGYEIMDVYSTLRNNNLLNLNFLQGVIDPHPNEFGHKKIYELYLDKLCYKVTYEDEEYYVLKGGSLDIKPKEKKGYSFSKWNYDINHIDKDINLKAIYKKKINYYYFLVIIPIIIIIGLIIKLKKNK